MSNSQFSPGQRLIRFDNDGPRIEWVVKEVFYPSVRRSTHTSYYNITRHEKDVEKGRGSFVRDKVLQPYSDELWAACVAWMERRKELERDYEKLRKGKL